MEVDPELFKSIMGDFQDIEAAARLAASGGIPAVLIYGPGNVPELVRMEHVWVEAYADYVPSRGGVQLTGDTWVALDPMLKRTRFQRPVDLQGVVSTDPQNLLDNLAASGTLSPAGRSFTGVDASLFDVQGLSDQIEAYLDSNLPDATIAEVFGGLLIEAEALDVLPATLPATVVTAVSTAELPDSVRHKVTMGVYSVDFLGFESTLVSQQWSTVEIAGKRVTLAYNPASEADATLIETYGGLYEVPPNLLSVRPMIFVDGEFVAQGPPVGMGTDNRVKVTFSEPGAGTDTVDHEIPAGTYAALALDLQRVSSDALAEREARLEATRQRLDWGEDPNNLPDETVIYDEVLGESLHVFGQAYFLNTEIGNRLAGNQLDVVALKRPAEGLVAFRPTLVYGLFGVPADIVNVGTGIDVQRYVVSTASRTGDTTRELAYTLTTGAYGSANEHAIFEQFLEVESVSTIKLIGEANARGIPIFYVDQSNVADILPLLSVDAAVKSDISTSVAAGKVVLVPQQNLTINEWTGVGYAVLDLSTGAGAYLISGGLAGGSTSENSFFADFIAWITQVLTYIANVAGELVPALQSSSKFFTGLGQVDRLKNLAKVVGKIGWFIAGLSALVTAADVYSETGSLWKAAVGGLIDFLGSVAIALTVGWLAGLAIFSGSILGLIGLVLIVVFMTVLVLWLVSWLTGLLTAFIREYRQRRMYAHAGGGGVVAAGTPAAGARPALLYA